MLEIHPLWSGTLSILHYIVPVQMLNDHLKKKKILPVSIYLLVKLLFHCMSLHVIFQESCKVTTETFGHREIPGEMYDDIHSKTGVDLDNRQCMMSSVAPMLDAAIHSYISFIRTIPGFRTLSTSDQINLTKSREWDC